MDAFFQDLKHSVRMFFQTPGFTIAAVAALALGIGANTALFSVIDTVLLKPFNYPDPDRIVMFMNTSPQGSGGGASPAKFNLWREQTKAFEDVSAFRFGVANLTGMAFPEQIQSTQASAGFFRLCGADVILGRTFTAEEDLPRGPKVVVLAYAFWQRRFGGDPQVVGKRITLSGAPHEVVGVVGPRLTIEIDEPPDVYVPFQIDPNSVDQSNYFNVIGRLKPGITMGMGNAQLQLATEEYKRRYPGGLGPQGGFGLMTLLDQLVRGVRKSLLVLLGAVAFVLLIACANVANLLLARATGRKREIAIRAAVGAGRGRIIRQLLTESVLLSLAGGVAGIALGYGGIRAILSVNPGKIPRIGMHGSAVGLDWRVLAFTLALSMLTGVLFGLFPALDSSRAD